MLEKESVDRFRKLFDGRDSVHGVYEIDHDLSSRQQKVQGKAKTLRAPVTYELFLEHLTGNTGLGIVPIRDDQRCVFAALDIDVYDGLDYKELNTELQSAGLPFVMCRTKSGGAHLYVFFDKPVPAGKVRSKLKDIATAIGFPSVEIFPKQKQIGPDDVGNWINLPYFWAANPAKLDRYAYTDKCAAIMELDKFLDFAESKKISQKDFLALKVEPKETPFCDGPPCLQRLAQVGFPQGTRNIGLFQVGVYARMKHGDDWREQLDQYNQEFMDPPLPSGEVVDITKSLNKGGGDKYFYKCEEEPMRSMCGREVCLGRQFGVGGGAGGGDGSDLEVMLGSLQKLVTVDHAGSVIDEAPDWVLTVDGVPVKLSTRQLLDQRLLIARIVEVVNKYPPPMRPQRWRTILSERLESVEIVELPPDMGKYNSLIQGLREFTQEDSLAETRDEIDSGGVYYSSEGYYMFLFTALREFLIARKLIPAGTSGRELRDPLNRLGAHTKVTKIGGKAKRGVWYLPDWPEGLQDAHIPAPKDKVSEY